MTSLRLVYKALLAAAVCTSVFLGQEGPDADQKVSREKSGIHKGDYQIKMSAEVGWRFADFTGNQGMADTFINLHTGPRLLDHSLEIHSLDQKGALLDDLSMRSFGYGGDPNNATRLRIAKNRWYNFQGEFRRDRNTWDYNLLANPLNSLDSIPALPVVQSPHRFNTVRRMTDMNLHLAPQSRVSVRWSYRGNVHEGPAYSSWHRGESGSGLEVLLQQDTHTISSAHQVGIDLKFLPRTNLSLDQSVDTQRDESTWKNGTGQFQLANGQSVDLGLVFITNFFTCTPPFAGGSVANPACNGMLAYQRKAPARTFLPTTQFGFQSRYFQALSLNGRVAYSSGHSRVRDFQGSFQGLVTPANERSLFTTGNSETRRLLTATDFGAVWQVLPRLRLIETFRFSNVRLPGSGQTSTAILFGDSLLVTPNSYSPSTCPSPFTAASCPKHSAFSPADEEDALHVTFLGENLKSQQLQLDLDVNDRVGLRVGHRYRNRILVTRWTQTTSSRFFPDRADRGACFGLLPDANGICQVSSVVTESDRVASHEHTLLAGAWLQPVAAWRTDLDGEWSYTDRPYTRISPRGRQHYRLRSSYSPSHTLDLAIAFKSDRRTNEEGEIAHPLQMGNYTFNASWMPTRTFNVDVGYDYTRIHSQADICLSSSSRPPGFVRCTLGVALFHQDSFYDSRAHSVYFTLGWQPQPRLHLDMSYNLTSEDGTALALNPAAPPGSLRYNLHQPGARFVFDLREGLQWKSEWGYHGYNEKSVAGPTAARDFRGNVVSSSLRYSF